MKSLCSRYSRKAFFATAILFGLTRATSGYATMMSPFVQQNNPPPPPPTQPVNDVPFRHAQLESLEKNAEKMQRDNLQAKSQALQADRERNERLTLNAQKILQLSMDLNMSFEQGEKANSAERIQTATKLEKLAHEVRTSLANRGAAHADAKKEKVSATPASGDELLQESRQCVQLAVQLKQHVDQMLDPQNQHTISAADLKAAKGKGKQQPALSPIVSNLDDIENLAYRMGHLL